MGRQKHNHHEDIVRNSRQTRDQFLGNQAAADEHYAEQARHKRNKERAEREKNVPVAAPVTPRFDGRRNYPADPATDAQRFEKVCREADKEAIKTGMDIAVFKNREGQYFTWETKYISGANQITVLYTAKAPAKETK